MAPACVKRSERLHLLLPPEASAFEVQGEPNEHWLLPQERADLRRATGKRLREFAGGRSSAIEELGHPPKPLHRRPNRSAAWPAAVIGSITHTPGFCGAAVLPAALYKGIGIDAENMDRIRPEIERQIFTSTEMAWVRGQDPILRAALTTLIFSAKESFYKCQSIITGSWLGFHDIEVGVNVASFSARLRRPIPFLGLENQAWRGCYVFSDRHVFTAIVMS
jgi:4'-phosphopantetheinyl transferase EntD